MDIFIRTVTLLAYSRITPEAASNEFKKKTTSFRYCCFCRLIPINA
uniref:Uncharacterized protein n=1 Tax=Klebsiella pneumoniae TaxID=573 RepID=A0A8B0SSB5_KLEPN|nr:hypothetical protein [Klebsiella pneumoniae]